MTSSECELATNVGFHLDSKADCLGLCDVYASNGLGCTFAAWVESGSLNCRLYSLPFWKYLKSCKKLGGPPDLTGCHVDHPEDNTCDAVRYLQLILTWCSLYFPIIKLKSNFVP